MIEFAHIINPFPADPAGEQGVAQPITLASMADASEFPAAGVRAALFAVQTAGEPAVGLPPGFSRLPTIEETIADRKSFKVPRRLPLLRDILDRLYETGRGDLLVYTNADIGLQPYFYPALAALADRGYDAFIVNRRTISADYRSAEELPLIWAEIGTPHPGYDCFVFRREYYPDFILGEVCIGAAWVGRALLANMAARAKAFKEFRDLHLTFHIGDSQAWRSDELRDYQDHNRTEYLRIVSLLEGRRGPFPPPWRSYLLDTGSGRAFPEFP